MQSSGIIGQHHVSAVHYLWLDTANLEKPFSPKPQNNKTFQISRVSFVCMKENNSYPETRKANREEEVGSLHIRHHHNHHIYKWVENNCQAVVKF